MKLACETGNQIVELKMMSINSVDNNDRQGSLEFGRKSNQGPRQGLGPSAQAASECSLQGGDT
jgi:hypothetical protein